MTYLKSPEQISEFCTENKIDIISINSIADYIETNLNLSFLGYFHSISSNGFWTYRTRGGHKEQHNEFAATKDVLDFIINSGVFSDSAGAKSGDTFTTGMFNDNIVMLLGKMEGGRISNLMAFNTGNYFATAHADRAKTKSADL